MFIFGRSVFLDNSPLLAFRDYQATSVENKQREEGGGVERRGAEFLISPQKHGLGTRRL